MSPGTDLLDFLLGPWVLERSLLDERLGVEGRFDGTARFDTVAPGRAAYREEGTLRFLDHVGAAHRSLRCAAAGRQTVAFTFLDGRLFHLLELSVAGFEAEHRCGEDSYLGRFALLGDDAWVASWRVVGPHKQLHLVGTYRRPAVEARSGVGAHEAVVNGLFTGDQRC